MPKQSHPVRAHKTKVRAAERKLQIARANAIQRYADLEQALCELFSYLSDTDPVVAGTIFFRIVNTRSRATILEKLMRKKHGKTYHEFFKSVMKGLRPIDDTRNEVIHWHLIGIGHRGANGKPEFREMVLTPPALWMFESADQQHTTELLAAFSEKCAFFTRVLSAFTDKLNRRVVLGRASLDIFHQAIKYPPPKSHPLAQVQRRRARRVPAASIAGVIGISCFAPACRLSAFGPLGSVVKSIIPRGWDTGPPFNSSGPFWTGEWHILSAAGTS